MSETEKSPPPSHSLLEVSITRVDHTIMANVLVTIKGCRACLVEGIVAQLAINPILKELINEAVRLANARKAAKEN